MLKRINEMEVNLETQSAPLAFRRQADANSPLHWRFMQAAQYSDEWVELRGGKDKSRLIGKFTSFYICRGKLGSPTDFCWSVIPSKEWERKMEDPLASKQRWYCNSCGARYKTAWGMLIEILTADAVMYVQADIPDMNVEDIRAMYLEDRLKPTDPEDLYARIRDLAPVTTNLLRPMEPSEQWNTEKPFNPRVYKFVSPDVFAQVPKFSWHQVFNFDPKALMDTSEADSAGAMSSGAGS